jgi:hypothetical protein
MTTHKLYRFALSSSAAAMLWWVSAAGAGEAVPHQGANVDPAKLGTSPRTEGVAQAALADQIARHADRTRDVLAMIAAVRLMGQVSPRAVKFDMKSEGAPKPAAAGAAAVTTRDTTVVGLLARARQYAGVRNDLNGVIDEVARTVAKGRQDGPARIASRIQPGVTDLYSVSFNGNEPAMVALTGDGYSDLDLFVEDDKGNRVCASNSAVDDEICRWTPRWTGTFRIRVRNIGTLPNEYRLWSN